MAINYWSIAQKEIGVLFCMFLYSVSFEFGGGFFFFQFLLEYSSFLLYSKVNQLYLYVLPLFFRLPSHLGHLTSWSFASGSPGNGASASASVLPMNFQGWFPSGLTGLISLLSKGLSGFFWNRAVCPLVLLDMIYNKKDILHHNTQIKKKKKVSWNSIYACDAFGEKLFN